MRSEQADSRDTGGGVSSRGGVFAACNDAGSAVEARSQAERSERVAREEEGRAGSGVRERPPRNPKGPSVVDLFFSEELSKHAPKGSKLGGSMRSTVLCISLWCLVLTYLLL